MANFKDIIGQDQIKTHLLDGIYREIFPTLILLMAKQDQADVYLHLP